MSADVFLRAATDRIFAEQASCSLLPQPKIFRVFLVDLDETRTFKELLMNLLYAFKTTLLLRKKRKSESTSRQNYESLIPFTFDTPIWGCRCIRQTSG